MADIKSEMRADPDILEAVAGLWPELTPEAVLADLFADPERLARAAPALSEADRGELVRTGPGFSPADAPLLDELAERATPDDDPAGVPVGELAELAPALRSRVWRRLLLRSGAPAGDLTAGHVAACDRLVTDWHGQGPLHLPGDLRVRRDRDRVHIARAPGGQ